MWRKVVWCGLMLISSWATALDLRVPSLAGRQQAYFLSLIEQAMKAQGVTVHWHPLPAMPNNRLQTMLQGGDIQVYWFVRSSERDRRFLRIDVPLTGGMIGKRILMVRPNERDMFAKVSTLAQLQGKAVVAALGKEWFDEGIWRQNGLPYREVAGSVPDIYRLVASGARSMDYFPRGAIEVGGESAVCAGLVAEPNLVLSYPGDFYFYVSPADPALYRQLKVAIGQLERSGKRQALFDSLFGHDLALLNIASRREIRLALPRSNTAVAVSPASN